MSSASYFEDTNRNMEYDSGEPKRSGDTVKLEKPDRTAEVASATTDGHGAFKFANLAPGDYRVTIVVPDGFQRSSDDSFVLTVMADGTSPEARFGIARSQ